MGIISPQNDDSIMAEINITPLTDVLLVLLIIFMLSATFISQTGFQVNVPKAITNDLGKPTGIIITVTDSGKIYVDEALVHPSALQQVLEERLPSTPSSRVIIKADQNTPYKDLIAVMDKAKLAGYLSIALATKMAP